jgi:hypothetical protein
MGSRTTLSMLAGLLLVGANAACDTDPSMFDSSYGGGASTRCRPDPDDPQVPGSTGLKDREWEDPNDDGRPTCRRTHILRPRQDAEDPLGPEPVDSPDAQVPEGDGADGDVDGGADGGSDGADDGGPAS